MRPHLTAMMTSRKGSQHLSDTVSGPPFYSLCGWLVIPMATTPARHRVTPKVYKQCATCARILRMDTTVVIDMLEPEHWRMLCQFPDCSATLVLWAQDEPMFRQEARYQSWQVPNKQTRVPALCPDHALQVES